MDFRLIIMRHAKSSWKKWGQPDHERPLNKRGKLSAQRMGEALKEANWIPNRIFSSDSTRTQETWGHMEESLETENISFLRSFYHAGFSALVGELSGCEPTEECILVLGHNPGWSDLVTQLSGRFVELKTADVVLLETRSTSWAEALYGPPRWKISAILRSRALLEEPRSTESEA